MQSVVTMPANIEIKARVRDFESLKQAAEGLSDTPCQVISQVDTFFNCPTGRLKLRELEPSHGQLIYYQRENISGPKHSEYKILDTDNPAVLKMILAEAFGLRGVISKTRYLFLVGQTRIHLDDVEGLGKFVELEVVLQPGQADSEGQAIADQLMCQLGIAEAELIETAYMDMVENDQGSVHRSSG
jgi:predicted adenylyl cyclase CyaB